MSSGYDPDFDPTGIEGGVDTNAVPWLDIPQAPGMRFKPLRASGESGMISAVVGLDAGAEMAPSVHLGAVDTAGAIADVAALHAGAAGGERSGPARGRTSRLNARVEGLVVEADTELPR